jgi:hypothetical protein
VPSFNNSLNKADYAKQFILDNLNLFEKVYLNLRKILGPSYNAYLINGKETKLLTNSQILSSAENDALDLRPDEEQANDFLIERLCNNVREISAVSNTLQKKRFRKEVFCFLRKETFPSFRRKNTLKR